MVITSFVTGLRAGPASGTHFTGDWTGPEAYPASCKMGTGSFLEVKCGRDVLLTTHPLLVPRSWKSRAIPLPTLWATSGLYRDHFFIFTSFVITIYFLNGLPCTKNACFFVVNKLKLLAILQRKAAKKRDYLLCHVSLSVCPSTRTYYLLTPWCKVLEKLTGCQLVK